MPNTYTKKTGLLLLGFTLCGYSATIAEPVIQLSTGVDYSSGDYGAAEDTTIYELPFTARLRAGNWSFRARVPYVSVEGPGGVVPGGEDDSGGNSGPGSVNSGSGNNNGGSGGSTTTSSVSESGLGDISLSATWSHDFANSTYLDLTGRASLPTGDETKDLGTGETDFTLSGEFGRDFDGGGVYAFGGYKQRGGTLRENGALAGLGGYGRVGNGTLIGVDATWSEASRTGLDDSAEITAYTSFRVSDDVRLSLYALTGLTDNSPDFGAGLSLSWRTDFRRPTQKR